MFDLLCRTLFSAQGEKEASLSKKLSSNFWMVNRVQLGWKSSKMSHDTGDFDVKMSQFWRYVTVMKVCHSNEGMSHLCGIFKVKNFNETILMTFKNYCESIWRKSQETFFNIHLKNTNRALFAFFFCAQVHISYFFTAKAFKIQARISEKSTWKAQNITDWTSLHFKRQNECQKVWISTFKQRVKTTFF